MVDLIRRLQGGSIMSIYDTINKELLIQRKYNDLHNKGTSINEHTQNHYNKIIPPSIQAKFNNSNTIQMKSNKEVTSFSNNLPIQREEDPNMEEQIASKPMYVGVETGSLHLREKPDENSTSLRDLWPNEKLMAIAKLTNWYKVHTTKSHVKPEEVEGYVSAPLVVENLDRKPMSSTEMRVKNTGGDSLNLRNFPSKSGDYVNSLKPEQEVIATESVSRWYKVHTTTTNVEEGYVSGEFVKPRITDVSEIDMGKFKHHEYRPNDWNDWNDMNSYKWPDMETSQQLTTNCYAYAFNIKDAPKDMDTNPDFDGNEIAMGEKLGWNLRPIEVASGVYLKVNDKDSEEKAKRLSPNPKDTVIYYRGVWRVIDHTGFALQPGYLSGDYVKNAKEDGPEWDEMDEYNEMELIGMVKRDVAAIGLTFTELTTDCEGGYVVALVYNPGIGDYHWYRTNGDGTWSHKPGGTAVTNKTKDINGHYVDQAGILTTEEDQALTITDPVKAGQAAGYTTFLGYFMIK
jgi:hypothetical protein